jgi:hypothetical protein
MQAIYVLEDLDATHQQSTEIFQQSSDIPGRGVLSHDNIEIVILGDLGVNGEDRKAVLRRNLPEMGRNEILMKGSSRLLLLATRSLTEHFLLLTSRNDGMTLGSLTRITEDLVQTHSEEQPVNLGNHFSRLVEILSEPPWNWARFLRRDVTLGMVFLLVFRPVGRGLGE